MLQHEAEYPPQNRGCPRCRRCGRAKRRRIVIAHLARATAGYYARSRNRRDNDTALCSSGRGSPRWRRLVPRGDRASTSTNMSASRRSRREASIAYMQRASVSEMSICPMGRAHLPERHGASTPPPKPHATRRTSGRPAVSTCSCSASAQMAISALTSRVRILPRVPAKSGLTKPPGLPMPRAIFLDRRIVPRICHHHGHCDNPRGANDPADCNRDRRSGRDRRSNRGPY